MPGYLWYPPNTGRYATLTLERKKFLHQAEYIIKAFVKNSLCQVWTMGHEYTRNHSSWEWGVPGSSIVGLEVSRRHKLGVGWALEIGCHQVKCIQSNSDSARWCLWGWRNRKKEIYIWGTLTRENLRGKAVDKTPLLWISRPCEWLNFLAKFCHYVKNILEK